MMKTGNREDAISASHASNDLNVFDLVKYALEGGSIYTRSGQRAASKIIAICDAETIRQIKVYDAFLDRIPE